MRGESGVPTAQLGSGERRRRVPGWQRSLTHAGAHMSLFVLCFPDPWGSVRKPGDDPRAEGAGAGGSRHVGETPGAPVPVRTGWLRGENWHMDRPELPAGLGPDGRGPRSQGQPYPSWERGLREREVAGRLDICREEKISAHSGRVSWQPCGHPVHAARGRRAPTGHIGPQGHLVVVDDPTGPGAPEVGPEAAAVHLGGAKRTLEARTRV